jgi:hypothetical protein
MSADGSEDLSALICVHLRQETFEPQMNGMNTDDLSVFIPFICGFKFIWRR